MVTLLIAMVALLIAIVGRALLNPDEEREQAWPFFWASAAGQAAERLACRSRSPCVLLVGALPATRAAIQGEGPLAVGLTRAILAPLFFGYTRLTGGGGEDERHRRRPRADLQTAAV
jgi:hypothetical protein